MTLRRESAMTKLMSTTMTALLALAGASGALAQGTSGAPVVVQPGPAYSSEMTGVPALRQRQPRRGDLPEADRQPRRHQLYRPGGRRTRPQDPQHLPRLLSAASGLVARGERQSDQ